MAKRTERARRAANEDDARPAEAAAALASQLAAVLEAPAISVEELVGTIAFLDALDALPPQERARHGFKFRVCVREGPRGYLPNADWGETVPTEQAIAELYGPGVYTVECAKRRTGQGGGWGREIVVRIAQPRSPDRPAPAVGGADGRLWDMLERLISRREDDDEAPPAVPPGVAAQLESLEQRLGAALEARDPSGLPPWLQPIAAGLISKLFGGEDAPAPPPGVAP